MCNSIGTRLYLLPFKLSINLQPSGDWYAYLKYGVYNQQGKLLITLQSATKHEAKEVYYELHD